MSLLVPPTAPTLRPSFLLLVKQRRFAQLLQALAAASHQDRDQWLFSGPSGAASSRTGEQPPFLPLHILLQHGPPLPVVVALLQQLHHERLGNKTLKATPEAQTDDLGRTALHICCAYNCSVGVVKHIYKGIAAAAADTTAASLQDVTLMTPLHYACLAASDMGHDGDSGIQRDDSNLARVADFLVQVHPGAVAMENAAGMVPADFLQPHDKLSIVIRAILDKAVLSHQVQRDINVDRRSSEVNRNVVPRPLLRLPMVICCDNDMSVVTDLDMPTFPGCHCTDSDPLTVSSASTSSTASSDKTHAVKGMSFQDPFANHEATEWDWCPF